MMRAPGKPSPSSRATDHAPAGPPGAPRPHQPGSAGPSSLTNPAIAARVRQLASQAEHRRAI